MGPPDHISVDQDSAYISDEMKRNMAARDITMQDATIEKPGTISVVERGHAPLRAAYNRIRMYIGHETSPEDYLTFAVHAVNSTVGPEELCPIFVGVR